jgi:putative oxygen-independent coproporphyrinogen III oxidase
MNTVSPLPPVGLYVHIPWCVRKCPYCDFNSHQAASEINESAYVEALLADLRFELSRHPGMAGRDLDTMFIGGGTPSLFSSEAIDTLLSGVRDQLNCRDGMEVTLEANPGTLELGRFEGYAAAGVNRLSIGVQSFNSSSLQQIGRIHGSEEALAAIASAKAAGFDRVNIDLMCGLPGQTLEMALADIRMAIESSPDHISYYQLTLEPNTPFYRQPPNCLPEEDDAFEVQRQGQALLAAAGFMQYEVSAFARDGRVCKHNMNYWQFGDYLGIGAGAHSKITSADPWSVSRRWRVRGPEVYLQSAGTELAVSGSSHLKEDDLVMEFMLNALRLKKGFKASLFTERTGLSEAHYMQQLNVGIKKGLLLVEGDSIRASDLGWRFLDDCVSFFLE